MDDDDDLGLPSLEPVVTDEYIRTLLRSSADIYKLKELKEDDSAFRLRTFSIAKHQPTYSNGWTFHLRPTSRFYKRWFDLPDIGVRGWAIVFRIHDPEEIMAGWVTPEREHDADQWIAVLNAEIRDRLQGKNHPFGPYSDPAITDAKLRFLLQQGGGDRLYSIKEDDERLSLLALRISKQRPEFMIDGRTWHALRPESRLYKRWFELDGVKPARGWALIFRMFDPEGTPTEPYEDFVGYAPPEKEQDADRWIERINAAIQNRLQHALDGSTA
jgi:hypothetical protein